MVNRSAIFLLALISMFGHQSVSAQTPEAGGPTSAPSAAGVITGSEVAPVGLTDTLQFDIRSSDSHVYRIFVAPPTGTIPEDGWPVIYHLDGNTTFGTLLKAAETQLRELRPALLVGIGYPESELAVRASRRTFDLTTKADRAWLDATAGPFGDSSSGGCDQFLRFIQNDLKPEIERRYSVNRNRQSLFGHSFGGLFVLHTLFSSPDTFQNYVAASPSLWWNDGAFRNSEQSFIRRFAQQRQNIRLLMTVGGMELNPPVSRPGAVVPTFRESANAGTVRDVADRLHRANLDGVVVEHQVFPGEHHGSVILPAASRGMRFILSEPISDATAAEVFDSASHSSNEFAPIQFHGTIDVGTTTRHSLPMKVGDYVRGHADGQKLIVSMLDDQGNHIRKLTSGRGNRQEFHLVSEVTAEIILEVHAPVTGDYSIVLEDIVPSTEQKIPTELPASPRLRQLNETLAAGESTDGFWNSVAESGGPLVEQDFVIPPLADHESLVTFLWRGAARGVRLFGAPSNDHDELFRLGDSDVWYRSYRVSKSSRIDYKLAPDIPDFNASATIRRRAILATAQRDPLNSSSFPRTGMTDRFDGLSVIELPYAPVVPELETRTNVPSGTIEQHRFTSQVLDNTRDIALYRSAGYQPGAERNGLVVIFDGDRYQDDIPVPTILDNMVADRVISPTAAILISNPSSESRGIELPCNPDFARFLAEELMPWVSNNGISAAPGRTVIAGASYGGLAAAYAGLKHPELFGNVCSQSGSFWWSPAGKETHGTEPEWLTREFASSDHRPVRFYLEAGSFEVGHGNRPGILSTTRHLRDVLKSKGHDVQYAEFDGGHSYYQWRFTFPRALKALLAD